MLQLSLLSNIGKDDGGESAFDYMRDIGHILNTIQQTNESMNLLQKMWFKTVFGLIIAIGIFCILTIIPVVLSFIWLALGFELVDKTHYFYTVFWFFAIWIVLSFCVCCLMAIIYSQKPN